MAKPSSPPPSQSKPAPQRSSAKRAAKVAAAAAAVDVAAAAAPAAAGAVTAAGVGAAGITAAAVMASLIQFLASLRERERSWLAVELAKYTTNRDDIARVVAQEMLMAQEFARNSADRVASQLPQALAITDPAERRAAVEQILDAERRFAEQHIEAVMARAIAAVQRMGLRRTSPLGAFWKLGHAKNHTPGCLAMAGKFWPWAVLDRIFPPRHYGCTSTLHSYGEAVLAGWMSPSDVQDPASAVRSAGGVVMEQEVADSLLAELELRDQLRTQGVSEESLASIEFQGVEDGTAQDVSLAA